MERFSLERINEERQSDTRCIDKFNYSRASNQLIKKRKDFASHMYCHFVLKMKNKKLIKRAPLSIMDILFKLIRLRFQLKKRK
jgi:hypothetical protein